MAIEKFERFRAEGIINAAAAQQNQGGHCKNRYSRPSELMRTSRKLLWRAQGDDFRTFLNEFVGDLTHRELAANLSFTIGVISDLGGSA